MQVLTSYKVSKYKTTSSLEDVLLILKLLYENQQKGEGVSEDLLSKHMPWLTPLDWEFHYKVLQEAKLVTLQSEGDVLLSRDLHHYTFAQLYHACFPQALMLNIKGEEGWKLHVNGLFEDGVDKMQAAWNVPLSKVFSA